MERSEFRGQVYLHQAAGAAGEPPPGEEGLGRVRGAVLVGVVVGGRRRGQGGFGARRLLVAALGRGPGGGGHGRAGEQGGGGASEEGLHVSAPALVQDDHLDDLLALDERFGGQVHGRAGLASGRARAGLQLQVVQRPPVVKKGAREGSSLGAPGRIELVRLKPVVN